MLVKSWHLEMQLSMKNSKNSFVLLCLQFNLQPLNFSFDVKPRSVESVNGFQRYLI